MERNSRNVYERQLLYNSTSYNLTPNQPAFFKLILSFASFLLAIISGGLGSLAGSSIAVQIISHNPHRLSWMPSACVILVTSVWMIVTLKQGVNKGVSITAITFFGILLFVAFIDRVLVLNKLEYLEKNLLFLTFIEVIIFNLLSILSFIVATYSILLFYYLFDKEWKYIKYFSILIIIFSAAITTHLVIFCGYISSDTLKKIPINSKLGFQIRWIIVFCGFLLSISITFFSGLIAKICIHRNSNFRFLHSWALALASWGGTSFYNLDLSNVNFKNAKLANTDLRARKLYRTCFQGVQGLERARVDSHYLDLENPKVQKLLTQTPHNYTGDKDFIQLNLRGAYLQNADLQGFDFTDSDLTGADLQGANLQNSILVRTKVIDVDFTGADLTGACIQDWSVNSQTLFNDVKCRFVYNKLDRRGHKDEDERFPANRDFTPKEFESLYQQVENTIQLIFHEGENWQAVLFNSLKKLQIEDEELGLQFQGIEKRGDYWVIKVTYDESFSKVRVEERINSAVQEIRHRLADKERELNWLQRQYENILGIASNQAEALKGFSKQPFGNNFVITGSTITNLVGTGNIDYNEASNKIRSIVANGSDPTQVVTGIQHLLEQFQRQGVATTPEKQAELIQQLILTEAQNNLDFQQLFIQQGQQIIDALPEGAIATAIKNAIAQLTN
jgi:uncharacterized protein YjbI with pentapeptide repeats